jgi:transglutaminase-like putative cysteine protease
MKSFLSFALLAALAISSPAAPAADWWPASTAAALAAAGPNAPELSRALREVPETQRDAMQFLIDNMPPPDLASLKADFLLGHVADTYASMAVAPWARDIPKDIFLNDVLPYASLNERRDHGRRKVREIAAPLVMGAKTPAEAAHALNQKLFPKVNVKYSTKRKKPDQSSLETLESGIATCSGLSILLVEACRAVGVPARIAGTPLWTNLRGNHTWVEIWDSGSWHFAGAAEPDGNGLDHGWFKGDAAAADDTKPAHRIYASSFRRTGTSFPLVWDRSINWVPAVNVTARYTGAAPPAASGTVRVLIRVLDKPNGTRVAVPVSVTDAADSSRSFSGTSSSDTADLNNSLPFQLVPGHQYLIKAGKDSATASTTITVSPDPDQITTLTLSE